MGEKSLTFEFLAAAQMPDFVYFRQGFVFRSRDGLGSHNINVVDNMNVVYYVNAVDNMNVVYYVNAVDYINVVYYVNAATMLLTTSTSLTS